MPVPPGTVDLPLRDGAQHHVDLRAWLLARGAGSAAAAAGVVVIARRLGVLDGVVGLAFAACVLVAVPVSRSLSRRIVIVGAIVLGWVPALWWTPLPVGGWGRVTIALALLVGGLTFWAAQADSPVERLRRMVPRVVAADVLPFGAAGVMAVIAGRWASGDSAVGALATLSRGWDNSAHFFMTSTIRHTGAVLGHLGSAPGGEEWVYRHYPQGFHTVAATLMELLAGPQAIDAEQELVTYVDVLAVVAVVCVLIVVAGVTSLPRMAGRFWLALPLSVFLASVVVLGPGGSAMPDGFPNFVVAVSLLAVVPTLTVLLPRVHTPAVLLALGGAAVGIARGWIMLLTLAAPAVIAMGAPWARARWRADRRQWLVTAVIVALTVGGIGYAALLVSSESMGGVLVAVGGIQAPQGSQVVFLATAAAAACIGCWAAVVHGQSRRPGAVVRVAVLGAVPLVGGAVATAIGVFQVASTGELALGAVTGHVSYYFYKYEVGLVVVSAALLVTAVAVAVPFVTPRHTSRWAVLAASVAAIAVTQVFGLTVPQLVDAGVGEAAPALPRQQDWAVASTTRPPDVEGLLAAVREHHPADGRQVYVTPLAASGLNPVQAAQWYSALTGTWTTEGNVIAGILVSYVDTAAAALAVLEEDPHVTVVVPPDDLARVRESAAAAGWADRVSSY